MKIGQPKWYLSKQHGYCSSCDDQSGFLFIVCDKCKTILLECDGLHTFSAMLPLEKGNADLICANCGASTENAKAATSKQILNAGFTKDDYE